MGQKKDIIKPEKTSLESAEIKKISKEIENSSDFVKNLEGNEKKLYNNILKRLQNDTNNELTSTEYESLAKLVYFCDRFEQFFETTDIETVDSDLLDIYRKMKTQITMLMRDYREGKKITPPSIIIIKEYLAQIEDFEKSIKVSEFRKKDEAVIIDIEEEKDGPAI